MQDQPGPMLELWFDLQNPCGDPARAISRQKAVANGSSGPKTTLLDVRWFFTPSSAPCRSHRETALGAMGQL